MAEDKKPPATERNVLDIVAEAARRERAKRMKERDPWREAVEEVQTVSLPGGRSFKLPEAITKPFADLISTSSEEYAAVPDSMSEEQDLVDKQKLAEIKQYKNKMLEKGVVGNRANREAYERLWRLQVGYENRIKIRKEAGEWGFTSRYSDPKAYMDKWEEAISHVSDPAIGYHKLLDPKWMKGRENVQIPELDQEIINRQEERIQDEAYEELRQEEEAPAPTKALPQPDITWEQALEFLRFLPLKEAPKRRRRRRRKEEPLDLVEPAERTLATPFLLEEPDFSEEPEEPAGPRARPPRQPQRK